MANILVAGGAGFIGSHLCEVLINQGEEVFCVDNLVTGSKANISDLQGNPKFHFYETDITKDLPRFEKIDQIYNLASPASPADFTRIPEEIALTNSFGFLNLLKLAKSQKARIVLASTSEIYGDPKEHPQKETYWGNANSFGPRSCYDESKRFAETLAYIYFKKYGIDIRIARIFNTYGPKMRKDDGRVVSNFINQALEKKRITIYGSGEITRSFCFVSDMVDGLIKLMTKDNLAGEIFNLGNTEEYKVIFLAEKIKNLTKSDSEIEFLDPSPDDPQHRKPDISKAKEILGWEPKVGIEEGLKKTISYYQNLEEI